VADRLVGLCLLCHSGPFPEERFQGTIGPDLKGAGARWSEGQLRLRMVDSSRLNPDSIMPPYYRVDRLTRVAPAFVGKPVLSAEQIEDVLRTITTGLLALGFVGAMALGTTSPAKAQGFYFSGPGVEFDVGGPRYRHYHRYHRYRDYDNSYAYYPGPRRWNGCPRNYTIQDGVCKPYRGY